MYEIVFLRRGVFSASSGDEEVILTANELWLQHPDMPYRIRHPRGGDEGTVISVGSSLLDDYSDAIRRSVALASPASFQAQHLLRKKALQRHLAPLEFEETVRAVLESIFAPGAPRLSPAHRRLAMRAQEFLAAHPTENVALEDVAAAVGSSPHHLCRVFRRATGESMHRYQVSLRLRVALGRILDGERDLTALALDCGFSDHSHFTNAFRRAFGYPPSRARALG